MLFLMGEKSVDKVLDTTQVNCPICKTQTSWHEVKEVNYFTVFFLKTFPLDTVAHYWCCEQCHNVFSSPGDEVPVYRQGVAVVTSYLLNGYSRGVDLKLFGKVYSAVTGEKIEDAILGEEVSKYEATWKNEGISDYLKSLSKIINWQGKCQVVEAAYLTAYACSPLEYEDKVRVNLIANVLGVPLEAVHEIAALLQREQFKGVTPII